MWIPHQMSCGIHMIMKILRGDAAPERAGAARQRAHVPRSSRITMCDGIARSAVPIKVLNKVQPMNGICTLAGAWTA